MKIITLLLIVFFCFIIVSCDFVQPPIQDLRESNKYLRLKPNQKLIQQISGTEENYNGIILLISGNARNFKLEVSEYSNFNDILKEINIENFTGHIRKTSVFNFSGKLEDINNVWIRISYKSGGDLLFGYKTYDNNFLNQDLLILNNEILNGTLYYKSLYTLSLLDILNDIIRKLTYHKPFLIMYILLITITILFIVNSHWFYYLPFRKKYSISEVNIKIIRIFLAGILIRILVIPFFVHHDFLSGIWVPFQTFYKDKLFYLSDPDAWAHIINQMIHLPLVSLSRYIFPSMYELWLSNEYNYALEGLYNFTSLNSIFFILFILKLQFLVADIFAGILLLKLFDNKKSKISVLQFWFFNPLSIYVMYMISRFEIYTILTILLSLLCFKKNKNGTGFLLLGFASALRQYPILFVPFILLVLSDNFKNFIKYSLLAFIPFILFNKSHNLIAMYFNYTTETALLSVAPSEHSLMFFYYQIRNFVLFFFMYMLGLLYINYNKIKYKTNIWKPVMLFFLIFYASSNFEPQFGMWIIPFLCIAFTEKKLNITETVLFFILFFSIVILQWDKSFTVHLMMPIHSDFVLYLPSIERIINHFFPTEMLNKIIESFWMAINVWLIYRLFHNKK